MLMCTVQEEIVLNVQLASNFLASLLKKNWQNIKVCLNVVASNVLYAFTFQQMMQSLCFPRLPVIITRISRVR